MLQLDCANCFTVVTEIFVTSDIFVKVGLSILCRNAVYIMSLKQNCPWFLDTAVKNGLTFNGVYRKRKQIC